MTLYARMGTRRTRPCLVRAIHAERITDSSSTSPVPTSHLHNRLALIPSPKFDIRHTTYTPYLDHLPRFTTMSPLCMHIYLKILPSPSLTLQSASRETLPRAPLRPRKSQRKQDCCSVCAVAWGIASGGDTSASAGEEDNGDGTPWGGKRGGGGSGGALQEDYLEQEQEGYIYTARRQIWNRTQGLGIVFVFGWIIGVKCLKCIFVISSLLGCKYIVRAFELPAVLLVHLRASDMISSSAILIHEWLPWTQRAQLNISDDNYIERNSIPIYPGMRLPKAPLSYPGIKLTSFSSSSSPNLPSRQTLENTRDIRKRITLYVKI